MLPGQVKTGATFADAAAEFLRYIEHDHQDGKSRVTGDCYARILWEPGGEIPCATNEGGCREVVRQLSSVLHERWRICGPPEPPCGGRLQTACMLR